MNANGSRPRELTRSGPRGHSADNSSPSWSPDGSKLAFRCVYGSHELCIMNADGTGFRRLTHGTEVESQPVWLTPHTLMIETSVNFVPPCSAGCIPPLMSEDRLSTVSVDGGAPTETLHALPPDFWGLALSPDGHTLAYHCPDAEDDYYAICLMDTDAGHQHRVTPFATGSEEDYPAWLPDGRLTFTRGNNLYIVGADGHPRLLEHYAFPVAGISWARVPSGSLLGR